MQASSPKIERFEARLDSLQKQVIQRAADILGRSLTDFVVTSSQEAARKVIREHEIITLTTEESVRFANALLNPRDPNDALKIAAKRHHSLLEDQDKK
ncbi:MAG: DUF1778 domain-containing protein [Gammaproteobacteria bacterium]|nr:DUF1778 domain-containing protein [Gammaproteobacteria bacterium]